MEQDVFLCMPLGLGVMVTGLWVMVYGVAWAGGGVVSPGLEAVRVVRVEGVAYRLPEYGG